MNDDDERLRFEDNDDLVDVTTFSDVEILETPTQPRQ